MSRKFISAITAPSDLSGRALWFAFADNQMLVYEADEAGDNHLVPALDDFSDLGLDVTGKHYLGTLADQIPPKIRIARRLIDDFVESFT